MTKGGPTCGGSDKEAASGVRQKTCSFVRWGVQAAELEIPPVAPWRCSCWKRPGAKSPASPVLWDVQSTASWKRRQTPTPTPAEFTLSAEALIRTQVGRREEEGEAQGSPHLHVKSLGKIWHLSGGGECQGANEQFGFINSWLKISPRSVPTSPTFWRWRSASGPSLLSVCWRAVHTS